MRALVDTGAACSLLDILAVGATRPVAMEPPNLRSVTGHSLNSKYMCKTEILGKDLEMIVVDDLGEECILGSDILDKLGVFIDMPNKVVKAQTHVFPFLATTEREARIGKVDTLLREFPEIISGDSLTESKGLKPLQIDTGTAEPIFQRPYRAPLTKRKLIEDAVSDMLDQGIISPSTSPWASPVTLVPKPHGGDMRFCVDYRRLNAVTVKDKYPLPLIQDVFDTVGQGKVFSVLDLRSGYWQLPVAAADRSKTAFTCHVGQFQYNRVSFGLANAPSFFQRAMNGVLHKYLGKFVLIYIDDIIVFSETEAEHEEHLRKVFKCLSEAGLQLKLSKCSFMQPSVNLLGFKISAEGIAPLEEKVKAIQSLEAPKNVKGVRSFLGLANYYRQCIKNYAKIAEPMVALTRKANPFVWDKPQSESFSALKSALVSADVMAHPDTRKPYALYTDACEYAVGAILVQSDKNGIERPVQYISHQLSATQCRWPVIEKEAYALIYALQKLRPYLIGAEYTIYTDHKPLKCLFTKEMDNTKIQRWGILLAEYGAKIEYRRGEHNIRADSLSRLRTDSGLGEAEVSVVHVEPPPLPGDLDIETVKEDQRNEFAALIADATDPEGGDEYVLYGGVLFSERLPHANAAEGPRLVLPERYQAEAIKTAHLEVGHMSTSKTRKRVTEDYVWPGLGKMVKNHVEACAQCAVFRHRQQHVPMVDVEIPAGPMQVIHLDFIGPYQEDRHGHRYVLTAVDYLTGWAEAYPTGNQSARAIIDAIALQFYARHDEPLAFVTDNGHGFGSREWRQFCEQSGVECRHSTPGHPQGNAKVERLNRTLKEIMLRIMGNDPAAWPAALCGALRAYRRGISDSTGFSPFFLHYGRPPRPLILADPNDRNAFGNRLDGLAEAWRIAQQNLAESRRYNRRRLKRRANVGSELNVGDSVCVHADERITGTAHWDPGFIVTRVRDTTHWVSNPTTGINKKLHREKLLLVNHVEGLDAVPRRPRRQCRPRRGDRVDLE